MQQNKAQLKVALYLELLKTPEEELTCREVDLMFLLAADKDIQEKLDICQKK